MKKDPQIYLLHMRDALLNIFAYTKKGEEHFLEDEKTQDAVIYKLIIIGEAVKRLPKAFREAHAEIPWRGIARLRDIVIHDYDSTAMPRIWNIIEKDLLPFKKNVDNMLKELEG